jgi:hypothetical protein
MKRYSENTIRSFATIGAAIGWLAIILQLYLIIVNRTASIPETIVRFFSFFTILTNILVAVCFTTVSLHSSDRRKYFFSKPTTLSAVTIYIVVVGIVYNIILRFLWNPQGLQRIADELLHSFIPIFFLVFWIVFVPKNGLQWRVTFNWLLYPLCYLLFVLLRGASSNFYPYPFINVNEIGYRTAIINSVVLCGVFLALSALLVAIAKKMGKRSITTQNHFKSF